ncbi:transglutaminase domain-containing protein [Candidatus Micrarchaeota archaeon]|nr:transglutaminase domain-containing protein [Candidatus Micrarchaeota archaeon]
MDQFTQVNKSTPQRPAESQRTANGSFSHQEPKDDGIMVFKGPKREQGEKFVPHDPMFSILSGMFSNGVTSFSYNSAAAYIAMNAGLSITPWIPPRIKDNKRLCFTTTTRFFGFQAPLTPVINTSDDTQDYTITHEIAAIANGSFYNTCKGIQNDERMRALAYYIIQRYDAQGVSEVIDALARWVSLNIYLFNIVNINQKMADIKKEGPLVPSEGIAQDLDVRVNHSFLSGAEIIRKGGLCHDFANLLSDLLNSVGIPARPVMVTWLGAEVSSNKNEPKQGAHAFVEVYVPETGKIYIDAMPSESVDGVFGYVRRAKNAKELVELFLLLGNPNLVIFNMQITGAMPSESVTPELRALLEQYPATYARQPEFLEIFSSFLAKYGDDYWIHFVQKL